MLRKILTNFRFWSFLKIVAFLFVAIHFFILSGFRNICVWNTGISFSWLSNANPLLILLFNTIIVVVALIFVYKTRDQFYKNVGFLALVGGISNILNRIIFGAVCDYVNVVILPIFNLNDILITFAISFLILDAVFDGKFEG